MCLGTDNKLTSHSFHDGPQHEASARFKHQHFAAGVDVGQGQHLRQCVISQVTVPHTHAHAYYSNRCAFLLDAGKKIYVYYQIFPGSRPWYISARMRQVGLRMVTVFSYLKKT